jgi:hypothetical protein
MAQLWIDSWWQAVLDLFDSLRNRPQSFHVPNRITPAFFVGHDRQAFAQGHCQLG